MLIKTETLDNVVLVTLNRPEKLNALNSELLSDLLMTLTEMDTNPDIGCFVITGSEKAFAAGADIKEMATKSFRDMFAEDYFELWSRFAALKTPKVAAVSGFALGGGCELAMMCDLVFASESARFGQPEITIGVIPGIGATQRLTHLVGKSKAMDWILTGRQVSSQEALQAGLVSRVIADDALLEESINCAKSIAQFGKLATIAAKESINAALEMNLNAGLQFERRLFHSLFSTKDQKEGMQAFIEKRAANFLNQ